MGKRFNLKNKYKMSTRPTVSVFNHANAKEVVAEVRMPHVFLAPVRNDLVSFVHDQLSKNTRQAHGVDPKAGMKHSAESWGTGRAVARIPRISGSGTHRSGQAAFGNMCRKGRMFAPLRTWRKWHRKSNLTQKRHAVASALAASACAPLVMAKGHRVESVPELPLVAETLNNDTTAGLLGALKQLGAGADLERVRRSKRMRAGQGKYRNARFTHRRGPLVVYGDKNKQVKNAARNLPGVDVCSVNRLNLLQLAPGGQVGRFVIFTRDAFESLDNLFGTYAAAGQGKSGYHLQRNVVDCADLARIINADQVQSKLRMVKTSERAHDKTKKNPLKNKAMMQKLNPDAKASRGRAAEAL